MSMFPAFSKKILILFIISLLFITLQVAVFADDIVISVNDFTVESDNPDYRFLGKGISRLVSSELSKAKGIRLLEREEVKKLLEEQEFSLSDMADVTKQVKIGMMLSAEKIVFGEIIDLGNAVLISLRMVDVATGVIEWQDQLTEKLKTYDYIGAYFAGSILKKLGQKIDKTTEEKIAEKKEKDESAIVSISTGIDAYDRGDTEKARKDLEDARKLDPKNEVAAYYLAKLVTNTTKFKVNTEPFYSYQNPAFLGILRMDRFHYSMSFNLDELLAPLFFGTEHAFFEVPDYPDRSEREQDFVISGGYYFPLGATMGIGIEAFWSLVTSEVTSTSGLNGVSRRMPMGGMLNYGILLNENISAGIGFAVFNQRDFESSFMIPNYDDVEPVAASVNAGLLIRNSDESLIFDTRAGWSTLTTELIDPATLDIIRLINAPLFNENSFTFGLNGKKTFIVVKEINDISLDRVFYYGRILPAVEHFFSDWFSFRLGIEGAVVVLNDSVNFGYGVMGGPTVRIPAIGLDMDLNLTYRMRPSRVIEGMMLPQIIMLFNFNLSNVFMTRK